MNSIFEKTLNYNQISFCYSRGPEIREREIHPYHEILYYIDGDATFLSESFQKKLKSGTLIVIPKESYHFFRLKAPERFARLKISFPDGLDVLAPASAVTGEIRVIENVDATLVYTLNQMCTELGNGREGEHSAFLTYTAFLMLMAQINVQNEKKSEVRYRESAHLATRILEYINENLDGDISIRAIAAAVNTSESTLTHCFKRELGISLHRYIIEKRLIYAKRLIAEGENPSKIYAICGYGDYSSFYKAYKKMFGASPSE